MKGSTSIDAARDIASRELSVSDGQQPVGTVFQVGKAFMAFDLEDRHLGTFPRIQDATRSLESVCTG